MAAMQKRSGELDDDLVPDVGKAVDLEMRIVGEDGVAAGRLPRRDHPVVGSDRAREDVRPAERLGHEPLAELDAPEQLRVERLQLAREELVQVGPRHAGLHHLDEQALHVTLRLREPDGSR